MSALARPARFALAGALTLALAAASAYAAVSASAVTTSVTVTVSANTNNRVISAGFAGFSYEKDRIGAGMFDANDTKLVNLFRLLGPSVLRVGGNLVDMTSWNPKGAGGSASEIAPADVQKFAGFLQATGWKTIYGINLKTNTATNAASEAAFAAKTLGSSLLAFEIGNEPNGYKSESTYESSFAAYTKAIRAKIPGAVFDGPGTYGHTDWMEPFAAHEKSNGLQILCMHTYVGSNTNSSISGLLASTQPGGKFPDQFAAMQKAWKDNGIPHWRMSEANSYFHGGTDGVSNVEAAALWSLDFMYGVAVHAGNGVNFHGGTSTQFPLYYSPIKFSGLVPVGTQAVYYGELLWSLAGTGGLHPATVSGASNVTAWGIGTNAFVNNKSSSTLSATITLTGTPTTAKVYLLTAPSLSSKSITIAGSSVSSGGTFTPAPKSATVNGGKVVVSVPPGSAALVVAH
jgi:Glycosyl hydrolase family 79 C-terminal beta domain